MFFLLFSYIFPGVGLAAIVAGSTCITEDDFYVAAQSLASQVIIAKYNKFHV
jgi:malic enzyme